MINKEEIINYFKSIENEKFIYDNKPAKFTWSCNDIDKKKTINNYIK